jgi:GAF domain-containing protein
MPSEVSTMSGCQSAEVLERELAEARDQQAATAEILIAISTSPTDAQAVFSEIAAGAARLCDADDSGIFLVAGDYLRTVARYGAIVSQERLPLTRGIVIGHAVLDRKILHVADLQSETFAYPEGSELARQLGHRTVLAVPFIRTGDAIGVLHIRRKEARLFTERQIRLLKTFADQAVIAI